jgi:RND superfamily putative drug exporter
VVPLMLGRLAQIVAGRRTRWAVIVGWLVLAAALATLQPKLQDEAANENEAFLAASAESTTVNDLLDEEFGQPVTAIVAYIRDGGLTEADRQRIEADAQAICDAGIRDLVAVGTPMSRPCEVPGGNPNLAPETPPSPVSDDNSTALVVVETRDEDTAVIVENVKRLREIVGDRGDGLTAYVTGQAGFTADASEAFEGIDETLLAITAVLVLVLLLAVYRSPLVAIVPLLVVVLAYLVAAGVIYGLVSAGVLDVTGQATAILIVLMFGAGTDYCLLLVARHREEMQEGEDPSAALARAAERTGPTILAAGATVVAAMLVLVVADYRATRGMGPVLAIGVAVMVLAGLTLLPAMLAVLGRRVSARRAHTGVWTRVGGFVRARPGTVAGVALAVLLAGALGALDGRGSLGVAENLRDEPDSVRGQELIADRFGPGRAAPLSLVAEAGRATDVAAALEQDPAVDRTVTVTQTSDGRLLLFDVLLAVDPFSDEAEAAVPRLREAARRAADGETALLGGAIAEAHDAREAQASDAALVVPLALLVVFLIVAATVRALVAPLYLVGTVVLSYAFAIGASSLVFTHALGQPDSDPGLPLFAFIFLLALGVDYNLFLIARVREEQRGRATADAVVAGLARTGAVITSAGLVLAGTFATLLAIPVVGLAQIGFAIVLGVLVDTFVVRSLLVPAIAILLGPRNWWPAAVAASALLFIGLPAPPARADLFWANSTPDGSLPLPAIGRAAVDGTGVDQDFVVVDPDSGPTNPCGVAIDDRYVYWANATGPAGSGTTLGRARRDGMQVDDSFIEGADGPCGVVVSATHIYWANYAGDSIGRARIDGTQVEPDWLPTAHPGPCGVTVDDRYVYWANLGSGFTFSSIGRARLDGTDVEPDFVGAIAPCGVAVNATHLFWANYIQGYGSSIGRSRLDGSEPQLDFITAEGDSCTAPCLTGPVGVAIDSGHIYWANQSRNSIGRADIDGSDINRDFVVGASSPVGVAVDPTPPTPPASPPDTGPPSPPVSPSADLPPSNVISLGTRSRDRRRGTAVLRVRVPGPGRLVVGGRGVRRRARTITRAGTVQVTIRASGTAAHKLRKRGRLRVRPTLTFTPSGGVPRTRRTAVVLVRRPFAERQTKEIE